MVLIALPTPKKSGNQHPVPLRDVCDILSSFSVDELNMFYSFIKKNKKFSIVAITQYLQKHPQHWGLLFWFLPYPIHLEMYTNNAFGETYYDEKIVNDILKINKISIASIYINEQEQSQRDKLLTQYFVNLTNRSGSNFSFESTRFMQRLDLFKTLFPGLDWTNLVIGTDLILFLASDLEIDSQKKLNYQFNIYSKVNKRALGECPLYFHKNLTYHPQHNENVETTLLHYCHSVEGSFQILLKGLETIVFDLSTEKILTTNEFYQSHKWDNHVYPTCQFNLQTQTILKYNIRNRHAYLSALQKEIQHDLCGYMNEIHFEVSHSKHPKCYICCQHFNPYLVLKRYQHHCADCGILEYTKLIEKVDLSNLKVYVSGCRIKIGYSTVLRFLRLGAKVIGSTRFPKLAWLNFQKESDFMIWKDKLTIIKSDFNLYSDVNKLIAYLAKENINVLVNNACQTIRPSKEYLNTLGKAEHTLQLAIKDNSTSTSTSALENTIVDTRTDIAIATNTVSDQLVMFRGSDIDIVEYSDVQSELSLNGINLKLNRYGDIDDIQGRNSTWFKEIDKVDPEEIIEVVTINQLVPTLIINQLKPTMSTPGFIINVTAVEGQFNTTSKDAYHPHTNMAKAAINMMIRTMSEEKNAKVLSYAVDPGFVSGVRERTLRTGVTPIQSDDGASRVVDPVVMWFKSEPLEAGKYRHYKKDSW
jgi:NAD(P)-dependent dehydrogenase (short-subunit alcohol dehydrogenase family)